MGKEKMKMQLDLESLEKSDKTYEQITAKDTDRIKENSQKISEEIVNLEKDLIRLDDDNKEL